MSEENMDLQDLNSRVDISTEEDEIKSEPRPVAPTRRRKMLRAELIVTEGIQQTKVNNTNFEPAKVSSPITHPEDSTLGNTTENTFIIISPKTKSNYDSTNDKKTQESQGVNTSSFLLHNIGDSDLSIDNPENVRRLSRSKTKTRSLDLWMASKGKYNLKPQYKVKSRAETIRRLKQEVLSPRMNRSASLKWTSKFNSRSFEEKRKTRGYTYFPGKKELSDMEILQQVSVLNLDTGERVPLSAAEDKLPQCINPLSLHIIKLASKQAPRKSTNNNGICQETSNIRKSAAKFKRVVETTVKHTADKAKYVISDISGSYSPVKSSLPIKIVKYKISRSNRGPYEFQYIKSVQDLLSQHMGPVWCMRFSACGRLLATAGQNKLLTIWVLRDAYAFFEDMRAKCNEDQTISPTVSKESLFSQVSSQELVNVDDAGPFMSQPFYCYSGHTSDILDISWSDNYFILSSSMDKTVRLWHMSRKECLCWFQHADFVTAIAFHPKDDRYFISGSLDGKLRLWNIPEKKVAVWNRIDGQTKFITAANFCRGGQYAVVGTYDGRCIFYAMDGLKYHTQIHVRSNRGRNVLGRKITGIEVMPGEGNAHKMLVTSNDSRIRLYDVRELTLSCKYKGIVNVSSQIKASFSQDGRYIVSGSETHHMYIWETQHHHTKFNSVRKDRNDFWQAIKAHNSVVTCSVFAPHPDLIVKLVEESEQLCEKNDPQTGEVTISRDYVLVSADFKGCIKVCVNKIRRRSLSPM